MIYLLQIYASRQQKNVKQKKCDLLCWDIFPEDQRLKLKKAMSGQKNEDPAPENHTTTMTATAQPESEQQTTTTNMPVASSNVDQQTAGPMAESNDQDTMPMAESNDQATVVEDHSCVVEEPKQKRKKRGPKGQATLTSTVTRSKVRRTRQNLED
ncbi:hypothetical protein ACROYT_G020161 [Oculina patagonica]